MYILMSYNKLYSFISQIYYIFGYIYKSVSTINSIQLNIVLIVLSEMSIYATETSAFVSMAAYGKPALDRGSRKRSREKTVPIISSGTYSDKNIQTGGVDFLNSCRTLYIQPYTVILINVNRILHVYTIHFIRLYDTLPSNSLPT